VAGKTLTSGDGNDYYLDPAKILQGWQGNGNSARRLQIADASVHCGNGSYSVSAWAYHPSVMATSDVLAWRSTESNAKWAIQFRTSSVRLYKESAQVLSTARTGDNTWVHVAATYDATTGAGKLYVNGVAANVTTAAPSSGNTNPLLYVCGGSSTQCAVAVDAVGVWIGTVLDATAIAELYNAGAGWEYAPTDNTPDAFAFTNVTDADPSTAYISESQTITGMDAGTAVSITGGEYRINGGEWTSGAGTIDPGDSLEQRATSSAESEGVVTVTVTVGTVSVDWTITTVAGQTQYQRFIQSPGGIYTAFGPAMIVPGWPRS
jgi:hypothetical protein